MSTSEFTESRTVMKRGPYILTAQITGDPTITSTDQIEQVSIEQLRPSALPVETFFPEIEENIDSLLDLVIQNG